MRACAYAKGFARMDGRDTSILQEGPNVQPSKRPGHVTNFYVGIPYAMYASVSLYLCAHVYVLSIDRSPAWYSRHDAVNGPGEDPSLDMRIGAKAQGLTNMTEHFSKQDAPASRARNVGSVL
jgi:hypothetical protein